VTIFDMSLADILDREAEAAHALPMPEIEVDPAVVARILQESERDFERFGHLIPKGKQ
jgi:hypothetical protein